MGAIANAAGMTAPVVEELERIKVSLGVASWLIQGTFVIGALAVGTLLFALAAVPMRGIPYVRRFSRVAFAAIPLGDAVAAKLARNEERYPAEKAFGSNKKYNEL